MIKVLADRCLSFDRGEKDNSGRLITAKTTIGFCELPDWVADDDYFKMAKKAGILKPFTASGESEAVLKESERLAAIRAEIKAEEERLAELKAEGKQPSKKELTKRFKERLDAAQDSNEAAAIVAEAAEAGITLSPEK